MTENTNTEKKMTKAEKIVELAQAKTETFNLRDLAAEVPCTYARVREVLILPGLAEKVAHGHYRLVGTDFEPPVKEEKPKAVRKISERNTEKEQPAPEPTPAPGGLTDAQVYKAVMEQDADSVGELPDGWVERATEYAKRTKKRAPKF